MFVKWIVSNNFTAELSYLTYKRPGERWYQCGTVLVYPSCRNTTSSWNVPPSLGLGTPGVRDSLGLLASTFKLGRLLVTNLVGNGDQYNTTCSAFYFVSAHVNNTCHLKNLLLLILKNWCVSVRPISYWLEELRVMGIIHCQGYPSVSGVSLSVRFVCEENRVPQCNG
jgi:hypothetical protein